MIKTVTVGTRAKINLSLDVVGKRSDGYHLIQSVMQSLELSDTLKISVLFLPDIRENINIKIKCNLKEIPCDEKNTVYKAAKIFLESVKKITGLGFIQEIAFELHKNIPHEAGLAGGSSNGAGVLFGLNHICGGIIPESKLLEMAVKIGADVSFCLIGGTAFCTGIGHIIKPLEYIGDYPVLLIKPDFGISTAKAYEAIDSKIFSNTKNVFEEYAKGVYPEIKTLIDTVKSYNGVKKCAMTGSGPTVFAIFKDDISANNAYNILIEKVDFASYCILLTCTSPSGPYIVKKNKKD